MTTLEATRVWLSPSPPAWGVWNGTWVIKEGFREHQRGICWDVKMQIPRPSPAVIHRILGAGTCF